MTFVRAMLLGVGLLPSLVDTDRSPRRNPGRNETYPGISVEYGTVAAPGGPRLRTIVTKPSGAKGPLPALFLVGWLSCDSVEAPPAARGSMPALLRGLAAGSGMLFFRVDKPGVGDSEGVCRDTDFETELAGYRAAFRQLATRPDVDPSRIIVLGWSNGGGFAPLVPEGQKVAGYIVTGGWVKTWFEHMMSFERRQMALAGKPPGEINGAMKKVSEFYDLYLNRSLTPGSIAKSRPDLAAAYADEPERQYGRPARFYQQLQKLNLEGAWSAVDVPVLSIHGEYDFIMGREDNERIPAIVNARHPGYGTFVERSRMDHVFGLHDTAVEGMTNMGEGSFDEGALSIILDWLKKRSTGGNPPSETRGADSVFTDPRDGQRYRLVSAGGAEWFGRNLNFATDDSFCLDSLRENCDRYGRLYPWDVARRACPAGSHVSSDGEWRALEAALGMKPEELGARKGRGAGVGDALKPGGSSGLDVLYSGWRNPEGEYREGNGNDRAAAFWTADEAHPGAAWHRDVSSARSVVWRSEVDEPYALSVRCVLDEASPGAR